MTLAQHQPTAEQWPSDATVLREVAQAEGYVASVCFKTGPPTHTGVELEWTVHHAADPARPVSRAALLAALGPHAPPTLDSTSPHLPLSGGGVVTVEPGGQLEISTAPQRSLAALHDTTSEDIRRLAELLANAGLVLGRSGIDPHRPPRPFLETPRYLAMARAYDRRGPYGQLMMRSTAGLQICLDAGERAEVSTRWMALHALGPPLVAVFANARRVAGRDSGLASMRMAAWFQIDPSRTRPVWTPSERSTPHAVAGGDPVADGNPAANDGVVAARQWARYALQAEVLCVRRSDGPWDAPPGVTFAEWIDTALPFPPTIADLDYHLGTLFPPVRPRGYLEVRYLDAQPPGQWFAPVAVLAALFATPQTVAEALELCLPVAGRWRPAIRAGLADAPIASAARAVLALACRSLRHTDLPKAVREAVRDIIRRRLDAAGERKNG